MKYEISINQEKAQEAYMAVAGYTYKLEDVIGKALAFAEYLERNNSNLRQPQYYRACDIVTLLKAIEIK